MEQSSRNSQESSFCGSPCGSFCGSPNLVLHLAPQTLGALGIPLGEADCGDRATLTSYSSTPFFTWRSLVREQGLAQADAVALMGGLANAG
jgi:hypothetical protein